MLVFLFTDIEGSTTKWERHRDEMGKALSRHDAILKECLQAFGGRVIKHTGDGFFAVFKQGDPLRSALDIQKRLAREEWGAVGDLRVRMALHAGEAEKRGEDYFGPVINRTARLLSAGWGGQVLLSSEAAASCALPSQAALLDLGTHLLKDLEVPQQIYGLAHPDLPLREFPPLRSLSARPNNLPIQPTPFLGREEELGEIQKLLEKPSCRLLTLVGPGGIGKTRLALQAAAEAIEAFSHGVYFVPLAPLRPEDFLVSTIGEFLLVSTLADALKFSFYSREDPKAQLFNYLREKALLLVFDNFEHLLKGAGLVTEILTSAPKVKVVVTSRERLNLTGEWIYNVPGMKVPEREDAKGIEDYSAVQLYLESARRMDSTFTLSEEEKPCVARICRLVDGIPLGIELASAWVRVLSCGEIAHEIEKNRDFLASTLRDMPERHRSLRAAFEYSWNLLNENERRVFRKMSLFRGGFSREAAEKVPEATLSLLTALVDKSLLRKNPSGRYELLEVLRQYAGEKLDASPGEREETCHRHADYFADFLRRKEEALRGSGQKEALEEIGDEIENVREAWAWAVERGIAEQIDCSADALTSFYDVRGRFQEGEETFGMAVEILSAKWSKDPEKANLLGKLLARQGLFAHRLGRFDRSRLLLHQSLDLLPSSSREEIAFSLNNLGHVAFSRLDFEEAKRRYQESLALFKGLADRRGMALSLNYLGNVADELRAYREAQGLYQESLALFKGLADRRGMAGVLINLGIVAFNLGEGEVAQGLYRESLAVFKELGDRRGMALTLNNWGMALTLLNRDEGSERAAAYREAGELYQESLAILKELGDRLRIALSLLNLGRVSSGLGDYRQSREYYRDALRNAVEARAMSLALGVLIELAVLQVKEAETASGPAKDKEQAVELLALVLEHPATTREIKDQALRIQAELASALPPAQLASAQERGRAKTLEQAIEELLKDGLLGPGEP